MCVARSSPIRQPLFKYTLRSPWLLLYTFSDSYTTTTTHTPWVHRYLSITSMVLLHYSYSDTTCSQKKVLDSNKRAFAPSLFTWMFLPRKVVKSMI